MPDEEQKPATAKQTAKPKAPEPESPIEGKVLDVANIEDAKSKIPDIQVIGNGDAWQLLSKASSKSGKWMKSTKALYIAGYGVVLQVSTQQGDSVAEAITLIPNVRIVDDVNGGKKLVA